jgi:hypothetical protein
MNRQITFVGVMAWHWGLYLLFQYALRSAPSVMMPQLTDAFSVSELEVSAMEGFWFRLAEFRVHLCRSQLGPPYRRRNTPNCHLLQRDFRGACGGRSR